MLRLIYLLWIVGFVVFIKRRAIPCTLPSHIYSPFYSFENYPHFNIKTFFSNTEMTEMCGTGDFGKMFNRAKPYLFTVGLQFGMAGTYVFSMASLNHGMSRLVFVVYRNVIAAVALAPFALFFERYFLEFSSSS